jgi:hypothetical protein
MIMEAMVMKILKASRPKFSWRMVSWGFDFEFWGDGEARWWRRKSERAREVAKPITTPVRLSNFIQSNK